MGRSSEKGSLHWDIPSSSKQEKMMFPAHGLGSMNTPSHPLRLAHKHLKSHTDKNWSIYTIGHTDTQKALGTSVWCKLRHGHTAAHTHTPLSKLTARSEKKPMKHASRDDITFNSAPLGMFHVQDVACLVMTSLMSHHGWGTNNAADVLSPQIWDHNLTCSVGMCDISY